MPFAEWLILAERKRATLSERHRIGSADAMIVNLLIQSKYNFIVSGDADIMFAMERINPENKFVIAP
jgi:hypothetical protein